MCVCVRARACVRVLLNERLARSGVGLFSATLLSLLPLLLFSLPPPPPLTFCLPLPSLLPLPGICAKFRGCVPLLCSSPSATPALAKCSHAVLVQRGQESTSFLSRSSGSAAAGRLPHARARTHTRFSHRWWRHSSGEGWGVLGTDTRWSWWRSVK